MPQEHPGNPDAGPRPGAGPDPWFLYVTCGLLLVIAGALGGLTLRFYRRATAAERQLAEAVKSPPSLPWMELLSRQADTAPRLQRDALVRSSARLGGADVTVLEISALQGLKLGLLPNDLLRVGPLPPTRPARSATRAAPPPPSEP